MFPDMSKADQQQLFSGSVVMYNGAFVFVESIGVNEYKLWDLMGQKSVVVPGDAYQKFTPVYKRLGFVNLPSSIAWVIKTTVRQYIVGICSGNIKVEIDRVRGVRYDVLERDLSVNGLLKSKSFHSCLVGNYPTLKEAIKTSEEFRHPVAFDKQFFINYDRTVGFKNLGIVGRLKPKLVGVGSIEFEPEYEHLKILLENPCGKDLRNLGEKERIW